MLTQILETVQRWHPLKILLVSVLASELVSTLVVSSLSLLFHGQLRSDFLITGSITALLTSLIVVSILMHLFQMLRGTRQELQQERDRLFTILSVMDSGIYIADSNYTIEFVNRVLQRDFGPGNGQKCYTYLHNRTEPCHECTHAQVFAGQTAEWQWYSSKTGRSYAIYDAPLVYPNGSISKIAFLHDITELLHNAQALRESEERYRTLFESTLHDLNERKKLEADLLEAKERAEAASKAKSDFLSTMSHEIRTPMNVVLAMGELLCESSLTPTQKTLVNHLQTAGNNLLTLINHILDLAKIESGKVQLVAEPMKITTLLENAVAMLRPLAQEKNLQMECLIANDLPEWLLMDGDRLNQVLTNLLGNALKFTRVGTITLQATCDTPSTWHLAITDSGIGIESTQLERIFDAFTQVDASSTRSYGGTGLGLAISRKLITIMGGQLWAESQVGTGSTFHITLPLTPCAAPETRSIIPEKHTAPTPLKLLLVDDTEENHMVIEAFLANTPHHLTIVNNGEEAVHQVKQHTFDLVLMDMQMPIMDGYTATRLIRQWEQATQRQPVIIAALTAHALSGDSQKSIAAGCNLHLTKPLRKGKLLDMLQEVGKQNAI